MCPPSPPPLSYRRQTPLTFTTRLSDCAAGSAAPRADSSLVGVGGGGASYR